MNCNLLIFQPKISGYKSWLFMGLERSYAQLWVSEKGESFFARPDLSYPDWVRHTSFKWGEVVTAWSVFLLALNEGKHFGVLCACPHGMFGTAMMFAKDGIGAKRWERQPPMTVRSSINLDEVCTLIRWRVLNFAETTDSYGLEVIVGSPECVEKFYAIDPAYGIHQSAFCRSLDYETNPCRALSSVWVRCLAILTGPLGVADSFGGVQEFIERRVTISQILMCIPDLMVDLHYNETGEKIIESKAFQEKSKLERYINTLRFMCTSLLTRWTSLKRLSEKEKCSQNFQLKVYADLEKITETQMFFANQVAEWIRELAGTMHEPNLCSDSSTGKFETLVSRVASRYEKFTFGVPDHSKDKPENNDLLSTTRSYAVVGLSFAFLHILKGSCVITQTHRKRSRESDIESNSETESESTSDM